jgi:hypothetical protein
MMQNVRKKTSPPFGTWGKTIKQLPLVTGLVPLLYCLWTKPSCYFYCFSSVVALVMQIWSDTSFVVVFNFEHYSLQCDALACKCIVGLSFVLSLSNNTTFAAVFRLAIEPNVRVFRRCLFRHVVIERLLKLRHPFWVGCFRQLFKLENDCSCESLLAPPFWVGYHW